MSEVNYDCAVNSVSGVRPADLRRQFNLFGSLDNETKCDADKKRPSLVDAE